MSRSALLCACLLAALLTWAAPARATHVACGDVITQDTTLDSDLMDCPGDGVVIGAAGVRLDLDGHVIDGPGGPFIFVAGVSNKGGYDRVTVTGGTITGYFLAVEMWKAQGAAVTHIDTLGGVFFRNSPDVRIENNEATSIDVFGESHRAVIARNLITSRAPDAAGGPGGAIALHGGFAGSPPPAFPDDPTGSPEDVLVERNELVTSQFGGGIRVGNAPRAVVTRNTVVASDPSLSDTGIHVQETVAGVTAAALVERNYVSGTTNGIRLTGATNTVVIRNTVAENLEDGIVVVNAANAQIDRNRAERNGDDGIDIVVRPATITHNTANFNGDLGIHAAAGSTDGGGNKAHGNGNALQCVNVSCK